MQELVVPLLIGIHFSVACGDKLPNRLYPSDEYSQHIFLIHANQHHVLGVMNAKLKDVY